MYYYCCLCILIVRPCILNVVYVFLLWSMYSYCSSMYSYCCLCILIVVYVFLDAATLTEVFPCFFLSCKANARVILAKTGHGPHSSKTVVLFYVLFVCKCVLYCCHRVSTQLQLTIMSCQCQYKIFNTRTSSFFGILIKKVCVTLADDTRRAQGIDCSSLWRNWLWFPLQSVAGG